jgi:hypothetical protein
MTLDHKIELENGKEINIKVIYTLVKGGFPHNFGFKSNLEINELHYEYPEGLTKEELNEARNIMTEQIEETKVVETIYDNIDNI